VKEVAGDFDVNDDSNGEVITAVVTTGFAATAGFVAFKFLSNAARKAAVDAAIIQNIRTPAS
jgi:hypothetical protein